MLPALYTIASQFRALQELDIESIDEQTLMDTLDGLSGDLQTKAANVVAYQKNVQAYADAAAEAAKKLKARADTIQKHADGLKRYIKTSMELASITKLEGPEFSASIQKNPPSVIIDDPLAIPKEFITYPEPPPPYPNKTQIGNAIKAGQVVAGAHLEHGTRLAIK